MTTVDQANLVDPGLALTVVPGMPLHAAGISDGANQVVSPAPADSDVTMASPSPGGEGASNNVQSTRGQ